MKRAQGLTFVDLLICLAIVAVLATLAVPGYRSHLLRARRLDAQQALFDLHALQQRYLFDHGRYAAQLAELDERRDWRSPGGHYVLGLSGATAEGWLATAVPAAGSPQAEDEACRSLTLDDSGVRNATGARDARERCWR